MASRPIRVIAAEIEKTWPKISLAAAAYLPGLRSVDTVRDRYIAETGRDMVERFLANAGTWRGDDARRIKAELKALL